MRSCPSSHFQCIRLPYSRFWRTIIICYPVNWIMYITGRLRNIMTTNSIQYARRNLKIKFIKTHSNSVWYRKKDVVTSAATEKSKLDKKRKRQRKARSITICLSPKPPKIKYLLTACLPSRKRSKPANSDEINQGWTTLSSTPHSTRKRWDRRSFSTIAVST